MPTLKTRSENRTTADLLEWSRNLVDLPLRAAIATLPASTRRMAEYHFGWSDAAGRPAESYGGKAVRPLLTLLAAEAAGAPAESATPAATAVELVHNFSLIHDDIMDGDRTRRHRPTVWAVFGTGPAILAGDAILTLAYETLIDCDDGRSMRVLTGAVQTLLEGQAADLAFERRHDVTLIECTAMINAKTGALLAAAANLGGLAAGASDTVLRRLRRFGELLGSAFQIVDDLLGIWGDPATTGKPVHSDLRAVKKSVPVVAALSSASGPGEALTKLYHHGRELNAEDAERAAILIEATGARTWCQEQVDRLLTEALDELRRLAAPTHTEHELANLAALLTHRDR